MHAIENPQLPRIGLVALGAVLLAIVVLLLAASRVGDIVRSSGSASSGAIPSAAADVHSTPLAAPSWLANPFAAPFRVVVPWNTATQR